MVVRCRLLKDEEGQIEKLWYQTNVPHNRALTVKHFPCLTIDDTRRSSISGSSQRSEDLS